MVKQDMSNFDSDPLTCDPALFPAKNSPNSAKNNRISPGKGTGESLDFYIFGQPND